MINLQRDKKGFSLIELMIAMVISSFVLLAIIGVYSAQAKASRNQQLVVEMMQNARAAMFMMTREVRMAGYDPWLHDDDNLTAAAGAGIVAAGALSFQFTMDISNTGEGDGDILDADEDITYSISGDNLVRNSLVLANEIRAVGFAYAFDSDGDGNLDTDDSTVNGNVIWAFDADLTDGTGELTTDLATGAALAGGPVDYSDIRAVRIWLLARTREPLLGYSESRIYAVGNQTVAVANDSFQYRLLSSMVRCRNF